MLVNDARTPAVEAHPTYRTLTTPPRLLMAPGPTNLPPAVQQALLSPLTGHKDPAYLQVMDQTAELLRRLFQTRNPVTLALPGTGGAGMEAGLVNLVEPGERVVIGVNGLFGERMVEIARRLGAEVVPLAVPWGEIVPLETIERALRERPTKLLLLVHGETSTGVLQPVEQVGRLCRTYDALFGLDAVATLGGIEVCADAWQVDYCYSGSQKCLSAPPGAAPLTVSERAMALLRQRARPVVSWYMDLTLHERYWQGERVYHHTAPVLTMYALHEACRVALEEGLDARFARHRRLHRALTSGLSALGLELFGDPAHRLPTVAAVRVPEGVSDARVRGILLDEFHIEITGGLGEYAGRLWRIGVMGHSASEANIMLVLAALEQALQREGFRVSPGAGVAAAAAVLAD
ncbi:MAG TPA: alanine--glyoxylate aminotransferase family protein [Chloroflexota bacterium]|jgi:alanine-glyoxylate transaminase/serine-glyoxylate transaminase/serine-pyruvate transaminase|nr:alanine--glyoxylate aminotransferase family protein [Chloroflexota bacterium]